MYSKSRAGKTSIINAKIVPEMKNYGYQVLPSARIGNISNTEAALSSKTNKEYDSLEVKNVYMLNAFQSLLQEEKTDPTSLLTNELSDFLAHYYPVSEDKNTGEPKPQILVFDQLEELFTFYPHDRWREQQKNFFEQVARALKSNSLLRIVFVIREDYLAELDPFLELLPERLRARFRLERLRRENALLAITMPLKNIGFSLEGRVAESLVDDLMKINIESPDGQVSEIRDEFVEPILLQRVWSYGIN